MGIDERIDQMIRVILGLHDPRLCTQSIGPMVEAAFGCKLLHETRHGRLNLQLLFWRTDKEPDAEQRFLSHLMADDNFGRPHSLSDTLVGVVRTDGPNVSGVVNDSNSHAVTTAGEILEFFVVPSGWWQPSSCPFLCPLENFLPRYRRYLISLGVSERRSKTKNLAFTNHLRHTSGQGPEGIGERRIRHHVHSNWTSDGNRV